MLHICHKSFENCINLHYITKVAKCLFTKEKLGAHIEIELKGNLKFGIN